MVASVGHSSLCARAVNLCVCPGGTPKSGAECTQHGAAMCAHCNAGYIINTAQTKCADVVVVDG